METYRKERYTQQLSRELTQISDFTSFCTADSPSSYISYLYSYFVKNCTIAFEVECLFWLLPTYGSVDTTYLGGCMLPSCCRCCHCLQCSSWCCSRCGWSRSWAMCQPARAEWQIPQCLANQACKRKKKRNRVVNNSKRPSQHHDDIYVNELKHPQ